MVAGRLTWVLLRVVKTACAKQPRAIINSGEPFMKRLSAVGVITMSTLILGAVLIADDAVAQKSPQELPVGAWTLVSAERA